MYTKADFSSSKLIIYNVQKKYCSKCQSSIDGLSRKLLHITMYVGTYVKYKVFHMDWEDSILSTFAQIYFRIIYIFDAYWLDYYIGKADQKCGYENFERNF